MMYDLDEIGYEAAWIPKPLGIPASECPCPYEECIESKGKCVLEEMIDHHAYDSLGG